MNLFPQDLGSRWHETLVRSRARPLNRRGGAIRRLFGHEHGGAPAAAGAAKRSPLGPLARFWSGGAQLDPATAATGLAGMRTRTTPMAVGMTAGSLAYLIPMAVMAAQGEPVGAAIFGGAAAVMSSIGLLVPRFFFQHVHNRPLVASEIEALLPTAPDELDRAFLTLVLDVIRQPEATIPMEARSALRDALTALAEAIEELAPAFVGASGSGEQSAPGLRSEAEQVRAEALREPDPVASASLARQADALLRRADAYERSAGLLRRTTVLRRELLAQTEALRAGLTGFQAGGGSETDIAGLADLADAARRVAGDAASVALARNELDGVIAPNLSDEEAIPAAVTPPTTLPAPEEPEPLRLRSGR